MKKLLLFIFILAVSFAVPGLQLAPGAAKGSGQNQNAAAPSADPLGRDTPSGAVFGFLQTAQNGNFKTAAEYLQMSAVRRQTLGPELARKLKTLMDRAFVGGLRHISTRPEGSPENGSPDQQTIGTFSALDTEIPVMLVRASDPGAGKIWLFSAETLAKVPELYDNLQAHQVETNLPSGLVQNIFLGMALWQWVALLLALPVALGIGWTLVHLLLIPRNLWLKHKNRPALHSYDRAYNPLLLVFAAIIHRAIAGYLGLPLLPRIYYYRTIGVLVAIGFFWFVFRWTGIGMQRLRARSIATGRTSVGTLMLLGERLVKAVVFGAAVLSILGILGFNLTTIFAGIGIGGIAVAFAAQKTLENVFGGVSVLADEVIRVGETCRFGDVVGTVEDISLRSTRIRTTERTELSIPNGSLATMNVENITRRDKILFNPSFIVRHETTADQLRYLLAEVRRMLYEHPKVETDAARIRFSAFDSNGLNLEIFSYVLTRDFADFAAIREDLLFRIMDIVRGSGTDFAFPSRALYMSRDRGLDEEKTQRAEQQVQEWRDEKQLPFPDFAPAEKSAFRGAIVYPNPDSAVAGNHR